MLRRVAHEYDRIIIFSTEPLIAEAYEVTTSAVLLHEAERFEGPDGIDAPQSAPQAVIALTSRPWSVTTLRELTQRAGAPVIAAIPSGESKHGPGDPVAKLARVITKRQVGVALGAGAAKGIAHLGVLRALDTLGVDIDMFSGSSIGAAIAAGRAAGYDHDELSDIATRIAARAVRPTLPLHSFLSNRGLRDELERIGQGRRFEDLDLPLAVCATDIFRRCDVTFTTGPVWPRILASMAIPGIYPALRGRNSYLVDGAVLNPVPTTQCRELGAGVVIGVRLTGRQTSPRDDLDVMPSRPLATETIMRCLEIMHNRVSELSGTDADATIQVCIDKGGLRDFSRSSEIADAGYAATMEARDSLAAAMPYIGKASP
jgi:NTE family protein